MYPKARWLTWFAGAAALAGLGYGFGRLVLRPRSLADSPAQRARTARLDARPAPEAWESALIAKNADSDALDLALDLDGILEAAADEAPGVTVRSSERIPLASAGDDEDPPSPDDLGRAWLYQATQSEHSFTEAELSIDLDDLAADETAEPSEDEDRTSYA